MNKDAIQRQSEALDEFVYIIKTYMLPLFDTRGSLKRVMITEANSHANSDLITIVQEGNGSFVYFYPFCGTKENPTPFFCKVGTYSTNALRKIAVEIFKELLKVTEYDFHYPFSRKRHYGNNKTFNTSYKRRSLDLAFELGMCYSLTDTKPENAKILHEIISRMLEWSGRTYEGKNVPFGIVIDFSIPCKAGSVDYLHFLENDCSAVFTDGIFTGILLDQEGKINSFLTRDTEPRYKPKNQTIFAPFQFADIAKFCVGSAIGVIALTNGEILLIKNQSVYFAKRGRKWVFFDWNLVYLKLRPYFIAPDLGEGVDKHIEHVVRENIKALYCTLLDVSFSHSGGCLSIVLPENHDNISDVVTERIDLYAKGTSLKGLSAPSKEKAQVLTYLLSYPENTMRSFFAVEKQLRREILSLDGATVLSPDGSFYCAGSIVSVPGGSSGGGRTAAAKRLAQYGVGIKISEDGYIEAWGAPIQSGKGQRNDSPRITRLFMFK